MTNRKLQAEIDRVLKKIAEGTEEFEEIWQKVHSTDKANLKEKYEADLKKEIKKLQRYRDQVKTWAGSSDIKQKAPLLEARKRIEVDMERFKVAERDSKTKAYSKEALEKALETKVEEDPEKREVCDWLEELIGRIKSKSQEREREYEKFGNKKRGRKNNFDKNKYEALREHIDTLNYHCRQLNVCLEKLEEDFITYEVIEAIREDLEFYVDDVTSAAFDYEEEDDVDYSYLYTMIEEFDEEDNEEESFSEENVEPTPRKRGSDATVPEPSPIQVSANYAPVPHKVEEIVKPVEKAPQPTPKKKTVKKLSGPSAVKPDTQFVNIVKSQVTPEKPKMVKRPAASTLETPTRSAAAVVAALGGKQVNVEKPKLDTISSSTQTMSQRLAKQQQQAPSSDDPKFTGSIGRASSSTPNLRHASDVADTSGVPDRTNDMPFTGYHNLRKESNTSAVEPRSTSAGKHHLPVKPRPRLPKSAVDSLNKEHNWCLDMLDIGSRALPEPATSERYVFIFDYSNHFVRSKSYTPRNPYQTPDAFPSEPSVWFDDPKVLARLEIDTLFFIFYFQQGTYQQYLAAQQLKQQSWRYHKKYLTWFMRFDDPKVSTEDFEKGTYVYFDYDYSWCQRIKTDFTFEYNFLEDELDS